MYSSSKNSDIHLSFMEQPHGSGPAQTPSLSLLCHQQFPCLHGQTWFVVTFIKSEGEDQLGGAHAQYKAQVWKWCSPLLATPLVGT